MQQTISVLARAYTVLTQVFDKVGAWGVLPAIGIVMMIDVVMRYIFNAPFIWALEFGQWMLLFIFVAAIPECTRRDGHIRMELLFGIMPDWLRKVIAILYAALAGGIFWLIMVVQWEEYEFAHDLGRVTEYLELPIWLQHLMVSVMAAIVVGFFVLRVIGIVLQNDPFPEHKREPDEMED